jgi:hypothetical protein
MEAGRRVNTTFANPRAIIGPAPIPSVALRAGQAPSEARPSFRAPSSGVGKVMRKRAPQ